MSLVVAAIAAAAAAGMGGGALLMRWWVKRRRRPPEQAPPDPPPALPTDAASHTRGERAMPLVVGDVVQVDLESRWLCSAVRFRDGGRLRGALLFAEEPGGERLVAAFAPPVKHIYWLERSSAVLPSQPPGRVEIGGRLLERGQSFPAELELEGQPPAEFGASGVVTLYEGAVGDVAVAVHCEGRAVVYAGQRIEHGDYERLGNVEIPEVRDEPEG